MAYALTSPVIGAQAIATTSATQKHPLGMIVRAVDSTYGMGEFIYLLGCASTVVGSCVVYNAATNQTRLAPVGNNKSNPVAFAMSANLAAGYGWYQIGGNVVAAKTSALALASNAAVGVLTAGKVAGTASGKEILGALTVAKATTPTTVQLIVDRPHMQGRAS